ncbi:trypsin-7-like [Pogonomyrmex barbatus]|uniref:Trypsin-7-like n=1 Tax=Pogonomyrmex barbatus TaxID=144034 RepID=A0A6I9WIU0_9HYME|nr:trypsin-7-like [Pogonomyrmex barbatus]
MLQMHYFILINLSCLIFGHVNTLSWYEQVHGHNISHERPDHTHCECGKKNIFLSSRIIGGREVFENEFPWMAGIISVNRSRIICGASIINDRYVITAAHCTVYGFSMNDMKVSVGVHNSCKWDARNIIFSVEDTFPHPNYNRETHFADIMLVKLVMSITFNKFVRPICLPKFGFDAVVRYGGQSVSALGWGFSENHFLFNKECGLRIVDLTLFKRSECPTDVSTLLCEACAQIHRLHLQVNPDCECGESGGISNRIVGGKITIPHIFPWVVAIFYKNKLHCGGTLINNQYVLTAGHCIRWVDYADLSVGLGMHDIKNPNEGYIAEIDEIILHEDFESDELHDVNDIALIRLQHPVEIDENVKPACLPHKDSDYTGKYVKVTGWGRVHIRGEPSQFLRQATLKVMSFEVCKNTSFGEHLTESMMCAYNDNTDACQGDSGGPLLNQRADGKYEIIGIVSWGVGCADPGIPGVYVKNTDYLNWIKYHSRDGIYCVDR